MDDRDLAMRVVTERLESYDRIWDLVLGAESEGQGFVPVSAIRAALTKATNAPDAHVCDGGCRR